MKYSHGSKVKSIENKLVRSSLAPSLVPPCTVATKAQTQGGAASLTVTQLGLCIQIVGSDPGS